MKLSDKDAVKLQVAIKTLITKFENVDDPRKCRIPGTIAKDILGLADEMLTIINADNNYYIDSKKKLYFISKMHPIHFTNVQKKMYNEGKYIPQKIKKINIKL